MTDLNLELKKGTIIPRLPTILMDKVSRVYASMPVLMTHHNVILHNLNFILNNLILNNVLLDVFSGCSYTKNQTPR